MNPYDNNPFKTDSREIRNEYDANRELAKALTAMANRTMDCYSKHFENDFWRGRMTGLADAALAAGVLFDRETLDRWMEL